MQLILKLVCSHILQQGTHRNLKSTNGLKPISNINHAIFHDILQIEISETKATATWAAEISKDPFKHCTFGSDLHVNCGC